MKRLICLLLVLFLIGCQEFEEERVIEKSGDSVTQLEIVTKGTAIDEIQLGFLPPINYQDQPEDFLGWLLIYDQHSFEDVWQELLDYDIDSILQSTSDKNINRGYFIDKYEYADGIGNTLNADQKTWIDGKNFELGVYYFYVATLTSDGVTGLAEASEYMDLKPLAKNIELTKKDGYQINFTSAIDDRLNGHFVFLSERSLYSLKEDLLDLTIKDLKTFDKESKGVLLFDETQGVIKEDGLTFEGESLENKVLNIYVASLSEEGVLDVARSHEYLINKDNHEAFKTINDGLGTLMLIGGGTASSDKKHAALFNSMLKAAGGSKARLAILSSSRKDAETAYDHFYLKDPEFGSFEDNYRNLGFEPIFIPLAIDNADAIRNDPYWVSLLESCQGAYLQGGDQYKHIKALYNVDGSKSDMLLALENIHSRGGVVAGTSAGMAAMGEYAYGYGYTREVITHNQLEFLDLEKIEDDMVSILPDNNIAVPGIGLIDENILVDTHFDFRGRLGRLLVAMRDTEKTIGIGVDEGTSFNIRNQIGTVIGHQGVFIVDASDATYGNSGTNQIFVVENLRLHYLTEGDRYDFWTHNAIKSKDKIKVETSGEYGSSDQIFSKDYSTTKILIDFIRSEDKLIELPYKLANDRFLTIALEKTNESSGYTTDIAYEDSLLKGYHKAFIENVNVSIYEHKGEDLISPVIAYMTSYTKPYKVYLGITDNLSGVDETSINEDTVQFFSTVNTLYRSPFYDEAYQEIGIVISEDAFADGDYVIIDGVMDLKGNVIEKQTWVLDGIGWYKK